MRAEKTQVVEKLHATLAQAEVVLVTHYKGLTVAELGELRGQVRKLGGTLRVTKNRLAKRALEGTGFEPIASLFKGPTAIAVAREPVSVAKALVDYAKKNEKLVIVGGGLKGTILDAAQVRALAELPSLDVLRARLVGLLQAPAARLVGVLRAPAEQIARVLKARAEKEGREES
ncbi:MAG: 50S ribosomal protein L10 [Geminicoccaceae bacterium]|nr:50S ribosomal protein L10 [Geminicoccaceae bacterium]MCS7267196.1 50S ribosomal protein L10 [Geminicoccaceae bacterium]MCX7631296.1 50S ribosomal protein L10 [Geminicoccaceae bacterium]MDW8124023.1 50S ribosomal protein L10 [Geminicoccaceae bacterium]MDW8341287.1 50S ribosomal protein L10 [Geminicoccaceae bacterium]